MMTEFELHHRTIQGEHDFGSDPSEVLGEVEIPNTAMAVNIKCKSVAPPLVGVSWLEPVELDE